MIHIKYVCDNESRKLIVIHYINTIREAMDVIQNIDDYLSRSPEEAQLSMQMMRTEINRIVPDVEETISWGCLLSGKMEYWCSLPVIRNTSGFIPDHPQLKHLKKTCQHSISRKERFNFLLIKLFL